MIKNGYSKGLNRDVGLDRFDHNNYYDLVNMRVITQQGLTTGNLESEKGNELLFRLPNVPACTKVVFSRTETVFDVDIESNSYGIQNFSESNLDDLVNDINNSNVFVKAYQYSGTLFIQETDNDNPIINITSVNGVVSEFLISGIPSIVGITRVNEFLIIFSTHNDTKQTRDGCQIWKIKYIDNGREIFNIGSNTQLVVDDHLIYNSNLGFSKEKFIRDTVTRVESDKIGRVYYTDYYNQITNFNVFDEELFGTDPDLLRMSPSTFFNKPLINKILSGGSLNIGAFYQYFYRLVSTTGSESVMSVGSNLVNLNRELSSEDNFEDINPIDGGVDQAHSIEV